MGALRVLCSCYREYLKTFQIRADVLAERLHCSNAAQYACTAVQAMQHTRKSFSMLARGKHVSTSARKFQATVCDESSV